MTQDQDTLQYWIETSLTQGKNLTKWERDFLESLEEQLARSGYLSERQIKTLERIYAEKTL